MKSWTDRLNTPGVNGIKPAPRTVEDGAEDRTILMPTARQVDEFIPSIPKGVEMDVRALRTALAFERGAEVTCPVAMGYYRRTVAEAAIEDLGRGMTLSDVAPFWRELDANDADNEEIVLRRGICGRAAQVRRPETMMHAAECSTISE
ncbi:hypothetical protein LB561_07045 [Mesorhizobium sp. B292B1B]|uniref:hypothetical protein n=1 Tax=unclassified Mesorhizobium TaxID=325217 RepID=UPI001CD0B6B7|nr:MULTISPECIES: hypothetical protein [unclassified Mesorhizobium]MCA0011381.1 hypothetical protein [Mesorhizobium sp. B294B1A1]MCA0037047.1 hypothetical protein [Mesorhizobium sp. B292B1B]